MPSRPRESVEHQLIKLWHTAGSERQATKGDEKNGSQHSLAAMPINKKARVALDPPWRNTENKQRKTGMRPPATAFMEIQDKHVNQILLDRKKYM